MSDSVTDGQEDGGRGAISCPRFGFSELDRGQRCAVRSSDPHGAGVPYHVDHHPFGPAEVAEPGVPELKAGVLTDDVAARWLPFDRSLSPITSLSEHFPALDGTRLSPKIAAGLRAALGNRLGNARESSMFLLTLVPEMPHGVRWLCHAFAVTVVLACVRPLPSERLEVGRAPGRQQAERRRYRMRVVRRRAIATDYCSG